MNSLMVWRLHRQQKNTLANHKKVFREGGKERYKKTYHTSLLQVIVDQFEQTKLIQQENYS